MMDAATRTGIPIWNVAKDVILATLFPTALSVTSYTTTLSAMALGPLALYNSIGALVTGFVGGIVLGGFVKIGHLPLIRVIPHGELMASLAQVAAASGGLLGHGSYPPLAFLGLSQTVANGVYGFGFGLELVSVVTRLLGEAV